MNDDEHRIPGVRDTTDASEGLLARWSRRKRDASTAAETPPPPAREADGADPGDDAQANLELTDADMPPVESLTEDSDYSVFLSPKVSEALRQQALQKLFGSNSFNVCDGLDDYAEDFTNFAGLGDIVTHEMRRMLEKQKEKLADAMAGTGNASAPREQEAATKPSTGSDQAPDQEPDAGLSAEHNHKEDPNVRKL